jgi:hypothetical protein
MLFTSSGQEFGTAFAYIRQVFLTRRQSLKNARSASVSLERECDGEG